MTKAQVLEILDNQIQAEHKFSEKHNRVGDFGHWVLVAGMEAKRNIAKALPDKGEYDYKELFFERR